MSECSDAEAGAGVVADRGLQMSRGIRQIAHRKGRLAVFSERPVRKHPVTATRMRARTRREMVRCRGRIAAR